MGEGVFQMQSFWLLPVLTYLILYNGSHFIVFHFGFIRLPQQRDKASTLSSEKVDQTQHSFEMECY